MLRVLAIAVLASAAAYGARAATPADLAELTRLFAGSFDSAMQWDIEDLADMPEKERHPWTIAVHAPVNLPALGAAVFTVDEFRGGPARTPVRRRVVGFAISPTDGPTDGTIRMRQYAVTGQDQPTPMPGCDVVWHRDPDELWVGEVQGKSCAGGGEGRYVQYRVTLTPLIYQRVDRELFTDTDRLAAGFADELPTVFRRTSVVP